MQAILLRRQGKDFRKKIAASQSICNVHIRQDNTFTFETSTTPYFKEYYYGTIYPDSLVLYATRGAKPRGMKNYEKIRTYHFFRFGEIPPSAYRKQYISYDIKYQ